jgi:hypothetical protein
VLDACALSGFAIDLAALASASEFLNLSQWLQEMVDKYGDQFASRAIAFLKDRIVQQQQLPSVINQGMRGILFFGFHFCFGFSFFFVSFRFQYDCF